MALGIARPWQEALARRTGWVVGVPLAAYRYLTVTRAGVTEERRDGVEPRRLAGPEEEEATLGQSPGRAAHRLFERRLRGASVAAEQLIEIVARDPNVVSPWEVMRWELGEGGALRAGEELTIRMAGPWDGPLRVVSRTAGGVRLATREGHALRGEFELRAREDGDELVVELEMWERADSTLMSALHDRLGITRRMQTHAWVELLTIMGQISGGAPAGPVRVLTET